MLWEAGIILELPPGVLVLFPSALILHWNIDIQGWFYIINILAALYLLKVDLEIVSTINNEKPTRTNTTSLSYDNDEEGGRASVVWFTQASMLQASELELGSVNAMNTAEKEAQRRFPRTKPYYISTDDALGRITTGHFPSATTDKE